jgi:hypothetical protein
VLAACVLILYPFVDLLSAYLYSNHGTSVPILRLSRDMAVIWLVFAGVWHARIPLSLVFLSIAFGLICLIHVVISLLLDAPVGLIGRSLATISLPLVLVFAAFGTKLSFRKTLYILLSILFVNITFGFWEIVNTEFWTQSIRYGDYLRDVKGVITGYEPLTQLPWNFFGYEGARRAAGVLAAPLANGFFISSIGWVALIHCFNRGWIWRGLLVGSISAYAIYLTQTRGAILSLLLAALFMFVLSLTSLRRIIAAVGLAFVAIAFTYEKVSEIIIYTVYQLDGSTSGHIDAFEENISQLSSVILLGEGVGFAGAEAAAIGREIAGGGEGALFSVIYQVGIPGGLIFVGFFLTIFIKLVREDSSDRKFVSLGLAALLFGQSSSLVISEHFLTFSGMAATWFLIGSFLAEKQRTTERK